MFISMSADWAQPPGKPVKVGESPGWFSYSLSDVRIMKEMLLFLRSKLQAMMMAFLVFLDLFILPLL